MRVVITGGTGFLGKMLAAKILAKGSLTDSTGATRTISELVLLDIHPASGEAWLNDSRVKQFAGDINDVELLSEALTPNTGSVFHLAAVVSGQAEADFDIGMKVNIDATRTLLELCRKLPAPPKFLFTSSCAVFGGDLPEMLADDHLPKPQGSYGIQKYIGEQLVSDMSRRGMIDGRSVRLPTITVRPGKPNKAASSFASGIIREPLAGVAAVCPTSPDTKVWLMSPNRVIDNILIAHDAPQSAFKFNRTITLPGITVTVKEMVESLRRVAGDAVASRISWQLDPAIDRLVTSWPKACAGDFAKSLGMTADASFDDIVRDYQAQYVK
ncbi:MAG: NAD-dependent epimerase/dehydratase family protein [Burkholderiales bacterium]|nr:MAG: NAD-dependent epimerase/dehydratase family protein [Burkholderiales bacterium]